MVLQRIYVTDDVRGWAGLIEIEQTLNSKAGLATGGTNGRPVATSCYMSYVLRHIEGTTCGRT